MEEGLKTVGMVIGFFVVFGIGMLAMVLAASLATYPILKPKCAEKWHPRITKYDWISGCLVAYDGQWVPEDNYLIIEKEGTASAQLR